ncbi:Holliday junction resolvase RecU [Herbinix luporum]|uniref:Holliday junction resolvase RecU n=1 Tax=Herbinix luporum TaxID=1679721 RepID=UPI0023EFDF59|nr:Holliday junction resolvase RecU [Herbinix luporum]
MASWKSRGLRGSMLEEMINITNTKYREKGLALIQKVPTPITPIKIDKETRHINLAYFDQKSTVDYIGVVQGIPVCFDAKECAGDTFTLRNVHKHQIQFMKEFEAQEGVAFLLIYFKKHNLYYYLTYELLSKFWKRALEGGRKSFRFDELDLSFQIHIKNGVCIHYLEQLQKDLLLREANIQDNIKA